MEPVSGTESKIRGYETLPLSTVAPDQVVTLDGPNSGPGNATTTLLTTDGIQRLPVKTGPFPIGLQPKVPLVSGTDIGLYDLNSVVSNGIPYYLGPFQFAPTTNNQGAPLVPGNIYYNTTNNVEYVFTTSGVWAPVGSGAPAAIKAFFYLITVDGTMIPPGGPNTADAHGHVLAFDLSAGQAAHDSINVYNNGVLQVDGADYILHEGGTSGDYITFLTPFCAGAVITVQSYGLPGVLFAASAVGCNTSGWVFNGTNKTFPIIDMSATAVTPGSAVNCLLVIGGRVLNPMAEYSVSGSNLTFTTAPLPGDSVFLVVGLPITDFVPPPPLSTIDIVGLPENFSSDPAADFLVAYDASTALNKRVLINNLGIPSSAAGVTNAPAGNISATTVQAAINELDTEKVPTTRTVTTGSGLTGGGDLSANRTIALNLPGLAQDTAPDINTDYIVTYDTSASVHRRVNLNALPVAASQVTNSPTGNISAVSVQNAINELDAEKVATTRSVLAAAGLTGGGDLSLDRTLALNINALAADATPDSAADFVLTYDTSAGTHKKVLLTNFPASVSGGSISNVPAGNISATTVQAAINELDTEKVPTTRTITAGEGLTGTGDLSANRTLALNINSLAADATPDRVADFVLTYDTSATGHKKVLISNLPVIVAAAAVTNAPAGNVAATTVQAAINELDTEKVSTTRILTAGEGLTGGGDLSVNRSIAFNINGLTTDVAPVPSADFVATYSTSAAGHRKILLSNIPVAAASVSNTPAGNISAGTVQAALNELDTEKVPTTRTITAGEGLTGTGDLSANRTLALNVNGLLVDGSPDSAADYILTYDTSASAHKKVLLNNLPTVPTLPAASVTNVAAGTISASNVQAALNELDTEKVPTTRTIIAGEGLTGTGDFSADRTLALNINGLTVDAAPVAGTDYIATYDASASGHKKVLIANIPVAATAVVNTPAGNIAATTVQAALNELDVEKVPTTTVLTAGAGLSGGGTLAVNRTFALDINNQTADATPDGLNDFVITYDASAAGLKKVLLNNLPGPSTYSGSSVTNTPAGNIAAITVQAAINELDTEKVATTRSVLTATGLIGGGALSADRTIALDINALTVDAAPVASTDYVLTYDASAAGHKKVLLNSLPVPSTMPASSVVNTPAGTIAATNVQTALNELDTEKVATTVTLTAGAGLTGGGTLAANRTFAVDINGQTVDAAPDGTADYVLTYDTSAAGLKKVLLNTLPAPVSMPATSIINTPAGNIAATTVQAALNELDSEKALITTTMTAGAGLTGGGSLAGNRTFAVDINGQTVDTTPDGAADYVITYDASAAGFKKVLLNNLPGATVTVAASAVANTPAGNIAATNVQTALNELDTEKVPTTLTVTAGIGLTGGGALSANRTFAVDINGQTADATPDIAADYVLTYDASATTLKKVLLSNLPVAAASVTNVAAGNIAATTVQAALNELDTEKVATTLTITAGAGLTGGGALSANRTLTVDINGQTLDAAPDTAADFVMTYDTSAAAIKKVLLSAIGGGGGSATKAISAFVAGTPIANEVIMGWLATSTGTLPIGLPGTIVKANTAATASYVVTIKVNGTTKGTLTWAAAGTDPTVSFTAATSLVSGDRVTFTGQATPDATIADIMMYIPVS